MINQEIDEIPLEQFKGELIPFESLPDNLKAPQPQNNQDIDEVPLEEFKGEIVPLTRADLLGMIAKTGKEIVGDINSKVNEQKTKLIEDFSRQLSRKEREGWLSDILKAFVKEPAKGIGANVDAVKDSALFTADVMGQPNIGTDDLGMPLYSSSRPLDRNAPELPSIEKGAGKLVDYATGGMTDSDYQSKTFENIGGGMHFLSQIASVGGLEKMATKYGWDAIAKIASILGSTDPKVLMGAFAFGATDKALENDPSMLNRLGMSTGAALGTEAALSAVTGGIKNPQKLVKPLAALSGLGKKRIDVEAVDAGKRIGVDLFPASVTDAPHVALGHQAMNKTPIFSKHLKDSVDETTQQYQAAFDRMLDKVAPKLEREFDEQANLIYAPTKKLARKDDMVDYSLVIEGAKNLKHELRSPNKSEPTKALEKYLDEIIGYTEGRVKSSELPAGFDKMPKNVQKQVLDELKQGGQSISLAEALRHKIELNKIMNDRNIFDRIDTDSQGLLKLIKKDVDRVLMRYGNLHNKEWLQSLKKSDLEYGAMAKRKNLEEALLDKVSDPVTGKPRYNGLIKALSNPKSQKFLKNNLGQQQYNHLKDFIKVGQALERVNRNIPNPSGTAIVGSALGLLKSVYTFGFTPNLVAGAVGASVLTYLLQSKSFVRTATKLAKNPSEPLAKRLEKIVKDHTGLTIQAAIHQIQGDDEPNESSSE